MLTKTVTLRLLSKEYAGESFQMLDRWVVTMYLYCKIIVENEHDAQSGVAEHLKFCECYYYYYYYIFIVNFFTEVPWTICFCFCRHV